MKDKSQTPSAGIGKKSKAVYGSDLMVEVLRELGIRYIALNPGASYRGLHDSIVNFGHGEPPEIILCTHEEIAVALANGYAPRRASRWRPGFTMSSASSTRRWRSSTPGATGRRS